MNHTAGLSQSQVQYLESHIFLPNDKAFKEYLKNKFMEEEEEQFDIVEQYYFLSPNQKNVYLLLSIYFYGPKIVTEIKDINKKFKQKGHSIKSQNLTKLQRYIKEEFFWDESIPTKKFTKNIQVMKKAKMFKFFSSEIFPHVTLPFAKNLFMRTVEKSSHLYKVKIRWRNEKEQLNKNLKRKYEQIENEDTMGNIYLLVTEEYNRFIIGCVRTTKQYQTVFENSMRVGESEIENQNESKIEERQAWPSPPVIKSQIKEQNYIVSIPEVGRDSIKVKRSTEMKNIKEGTDFCCRLI